MENLPTLDAVLQQHLEAIEAGYLRELMTRTKGDLPEAMRISGLGRTALYKRLRNYGIARRS